MRPKTSDHCATCEAWQECVFFNLPQPLHREFRQIAEIKTYSPGLAVVRQGDDAHGIFNLRAGAVRLLHLEPSGKATAVGTIGAGGILGLTEVNTGEPYPFTAETVRESILEYVPRKRFVSFLFDHPEAVVQLLVWLSQEFEKLQESLFEVSARPQLEDRLLEYLRQLGKICGRPTAEGLELGRRFTGQDLADGLGCSRQWISKLLGDLEHQGLIQRRGRRILLTALARGGASGG